MLSLMTIGQALYVVSYQFYDSDKKLKKWKYTCQKYNNKKVKKSN